MKFISLKAFKKAMDTMTPDTKKQLQKLDLTGTQVADVTPLASLTNLRIYQ